METVHETEVYGITYDRITTSKHQALTAEKYNINTVLESPSIGAKAAASLYSLGFSLHGCDVTLVNPEEEMMSGWDTLKLRDKVSTVNVGDYTKLPYDDNSFDMSWNFVTFANQPDPQAWANEMARVSKDYVYGCVMQQLSSWLPLA